MSDTETFTIVESICKFCGVQLRLQMADCCPIEWRESLFPLAACNRCGDFFITRRVTTEQIERNCCELARSEIRDPNVLAGLEDRIRINLQAAADLHFKAMAKYHALDMVLLDANLVDDLLHHPERCAAIFSHYRSKSRDRVRRIKEAQAAEVSI